MDTPKKYIYKDSIYMGETHARWAVFFDKVGIDFKYNTYVSDDGEILAHRESSCSYFANFYIPKTKCIVIVQEYPMTDKKDEVSDEYQKEFQAFGEFFMVYICGTPLDHFAKSRNTDFSCKVSYKIIRHFKKDRFCDSLVPHGIGFKDSSPQITAQPKDLKISGLDESYILNYEEKKYAEQYEFKNDLNQDRKIRCPKCISLEVDKTGISIITDKKKETSIFSTSNTGTFVTIGKDCESIHQKSMIQIDFLCRSCKNKFHLSLGNIEKGSEITVTNT